ncbi:hypothetical protein PanWU01x14_325290, partial [Parasponia andersonii]
TVVNFSPESSWRPRVVGNQSWSREESNGGGCVVIGCRTAERWPIFRSGGANFGLQFLRREAAVHGKSTRSWFAASSGRGGWARLARRQPVETRVNSNRRWVFGGFRGEEEEMGGFMQLSKTVAVGHVAQSDSTEK